MVACYAFLDSCTCMGVVKCKVLVFSLSAEQYSEIDHASFSQHTDIFPPLVLSSHSSEKHLHVDKICIFVHGVVLGGVEEL